jgi:hypothetical protein
MALGQDQDARREPDLRRGGGDVGEPEQRIGDRRVLGPGHAAVGAVRILRDIAGRHGDVLDGPERLDSDVLAARARNAASVGLHERTDVGERDSELHGTVLLERLGGATHTSRDRARSDVGEMRD